MAIFIYNTIKDTQTSCCVSNAEGLKKILGDDNYVKACADYRALVEQGLKDTDGARALKSCMHNIVCPGFISSGSVKFCKTNVIGSRSNIPIDVDSLSFAQAEQFKADVRENWEALNVVFGQDGVSHCTAHGSQHVVFHAFDHIGVGLTGSAFVTEQQKHFLKMLSIFSDHDYNGVADEVVNDFGRRFYLGSYDTIWLLTGNFFLPEQGADEKLNPTAVSAAKQATKTEDMVQTFERPERKPEVMTAINGVPVCLIAEKYMQARYGSMNIAKGMRNAEFFKVASDFSCLEKNEGFVQYALRDVCTDLTTAEWAQVIKNAVNGTQSMYSHYMRDTLTELGVFNSLPQDATGQAQEATGQAQDADTPAPSPAVQPKLSNLPPVLKMILTHFPPQLQGAALVVTLVYCCVLGASRACVRAADGVYENILLLCMLYGGPSTGKSRVINTLRKALLHEVDAEDDAERKKKDLWLQTKAQNNNTSQLVPEPQPKVRILTRPSVVILKQYLTYNAGRSVLICNSEIEDFQHAGRAFDLTTTLRKAFDGETDAHDTASNSTPNMNPRLLVSACLAGQLSSTRSFMGTAGVRGGSAGRFLYVHLERDMYDDTPFRIKEFNDKEKQQIQTELIDVMKSVKDGERIVMGDIDRLILDWQKGVVEECRQKKLETGTEDICSLENRIRLGEIARRCAGVVHLLSGRNTNAAARDVTSFVLSSGLLAIAYAFSDMFNAEDPARIAMAKNAAAYTSVRQRQLDKLPDTFTKEELIALLKSENKSTTTISVRQVLFDMRTNYGVVDAGKNTYRKTR